MVSPTTILSPDELTAIIVPAPVTVTPAASVREAIALLKAEHTPSHIPPCTSDGKAMTPQRCVLVLEGNRPVGIVTERDLMRLSGSDQTQMNRTVVEVMSAPVLTLNRSEFTDLFLPLHLCQSHAIHHLPVVDEQGGLVGLLTQERLQDALQDALSPQDSCESQTDSQADSQAELERLFAAMADDVVLVLNREGIYLKILSSQPNRLYRPREELLGNSLCDVFSTAQADFFLNCIQQTLDSQQTQDCEYQLLIGEAEYWFNTRCYPLTADTVLWVARDISERKSLEESRKQTERELQQQQVLLRTIIDTNPNKIFVKDRDGYFLMVNRAVAEAYHTTVDQVVGQHDTYFHPDASVVTHFLQENQRVIDNQQPLFIPEEKSTSTDGHEQWWQWQKYPITLPGQDTLAVLGVGVNITHHKQIATVLHQYERVVSATLDKIALLDRDYIYRLVNQVYLDWHGKDRDEIIGHSVADLLGETVFQTEVKPRLDRCLAGEVQQYEAWTNYENGGPRFVRATYSPYIEVDGTIAGVVVSVHDLTATKQAETSLELQNAILERIARAEPLPEILDALIRSIEYQLSDALGSIMLCDRDGLLYQGPAPHLPEVYRQALEALTERGVLMDEGVGSCGTAAFRRKTVITSDIATDPLWHTYRDLALSHGLQACWSIPIMARDGEPLGVLGVYCRNPRTPQSQELDIVFRAANIAGIAIERDRVTQALEQLNRDLEDRIEERTLALQTSENRYRQIVETQTEFVLRSTPDTVITFANTAICQALGRSPDQMIGLPWSAFVPSSDLHTLHQKITALSPDNSSFENTNADYRTNGEIGWTQWVNLGLFNEQGELLEVQSVGRDVTHLHRIEEALQQSEERFRNAFKNTAVGMSLVSSEGRFLKVNAALCQFLGYSETELLEQRFQDITYPDDLTGDLELLNAVLAGERDSYHFEKRYFTKLGQVVWGLLSVSLIRDLQGHPLYFVSQIQDISDRCRAEQENQRLRERLQFVLSSSPAVIFICKPDGDYGATFISDNITEVMGYSPEEFLTNSGFWANHIHPDDAPQVFAGLPDLLDKGHHAHEYRFQHQNGQYLWMRNELRLVRDEQGIPIEIVGYFADISDRKRLEHQQQRLSTILEASTDYIGMADITSGHMIWNNAAIKRLCGIESDGAVTHRSPADYHPRRVWEMLEQEAIPAAIATGSWLGESALLDAEGQEIPVSQLLLAHKSPRGSVEFLSTIMRDMRVHKEYEQRLEQTNAELLNATRLKDEFLTNMSHELRTPLNAILGMSENLLEEILGGLNDRQRKAIATIEESGQHLLALINDILDVSKISAGQLTLDRSMVSVTSLCSSSLIFVKQQALKKQIQLNATLSADLGDIEVDERRMRQVLINLLTNAVKFTPTGGKVTLEAWFQSGICPRWEARDTPGATLLASDPHAENMLNAPSWIVFSVTDTGIGIAPEHQPRLFQPFVQIDSSLNRRYEGTGLGLALVKQIVDLHGGSVNLTSQLGQGSCFTVYLPIHPPVEEATPQTSLPLDDSLQTTLSGSIAGSSLNPVPEETISEEPPLILLAEDNQDNINTFSSYLEVYGYRIIMARNGREAIDLAQSQNPDLILMDIQMPEVSGLEAIRTIRHDPTLGHIPIIALTALAMKGDRETCLTAGADEYIPKPVKLKQLVSMIGQLLGSRTK